MNPQPSVPTIIYVWYDIIGYERFQWPELKLIGAYWRHMALEILVNTG